MRARKAWLFVGIGVATLGCGSSAGTGAGDGNAESGTAANGAAPNGTGSNGMGPNGAAPNGAGSPAAGETGAQPGGQTTPGATGPGNMEGTPVTGLAPSPGTPAPGGEMPGAPPVVGTPEVPVVGEPPVVIAPPFSGSFHIGADITWVQHDEFYGATYVDTDGVAKDMLTLLKNHGFNSARLRTFVDPRAADGYDKTDGFGDLEHTVSMAVRIKQAGMGFLLDFHYSDNWADPGKQCIPVAWQQDNFQQLTQHVHDYTLEVMTALKEADALPQLVQIGNETAPGMLIHLCDADGIPMSTNGVTGSANNWNNLGTLFKAGIQAVKEVDPTILTVLHIDRAGDANVSVNWVTQAVAQNVPFDVFADTSYVRWQGEPNAWRATFNRLVTTFPNLKFIIPEYGNEDATDPATPSTMRIANDIMFNIPNNRGLGTWFYEPEHPVQAGIGIGLFQTVVAEDGTVGDPWPVFPARADAFAVYDGLAVDFAERLR